MRLWARSFIGVLAALTVLGLAGAAPSPPNDPVRARETSALTTVVALNLSQPGVSERAGHVRILPSRPVGMFSITILAVAGLVLLITTGRRRINDAGHDWRSLLLGAPPAGR